MEEEDGKWETCLAEFFPRESPQQKNEAGWKMFDGV
jgi:hypothetical protein